MLKAILIGIFLSVTNLIAPLNCQEGPKILPDESCHNCPGLPGPIGPPGLKGPPGSEGMQGRVCSSYMT